MKRFLPLLLAVAACAPQAPIPDRLSSRFDAMFEEVGAETDVPPAVLAATGSVLTRLEMIDGSDELGERHFGVMAIPESLSDAASRTDPRANIRLAAQWLSSHAGSIDRADPQAWAHVVADYAGLTNPVARNEFMQREWLPLLGREREVETIRQAMSPDYDRGTWRPSPNFDTRSGGTPFFVIIHTCEGAYSGCWSWLTNSASQVSAHYVVNSDGSEVSQLVDENDRAWHVGAQYQCANNDNVRCDLNGASTNANSIGIEHAGNASQTSFPEGQIDSSARLVCSITRHWNIPRDRQHILSHAQLQPANRTDPGANWPWVSFIAKIRAECGDDVAIDAGVPDAGVTDAGVPDAGVTDAGVADAGQPVVPDAGVPDAGQPVVTDAGTPDSGTLELDAGVVVPLNITGTVVGGCSSAPVVDAHAVGGAAFETTEVTVVTKLRPAWGWRARFAFAVLIARKRSGHDTSCRDGDQAS